MADFRDELRCMSCSEIADSARTGTTLDDTEADAAAGAALGGFLDVVLR